MKDHTDILNDYETALERQLISLINIQENINITIKDLKEQLKSKYHTLETNQKQLASAKEKIAAVKHLKSEFHFNKLRSNNYPILSSGQVSSLSGYSLKTLTTQDLAALAPDSLKTYSYSKAWPQDLGEPHQALVDKLFKVDGR